LAALSCRPHPTLATQLTLGLRAGEIDRNVPRSAHNARSAVGVGVASDCLEQKEKLLGKHGGSPFTNIPPTIFASYAA
jgi:hypothetical protein